MDLVDVLRTTGAVRAFLPEPVSDAVLWRILDTARFAPSGGNAQGWRVLIVKDQAKRRALRDLYLPHWYDYLALRSAGLRPWSPVNDPAEEAAVLARGASPMVDPTGFAEHLDEVPVLLALFVDLGALAATDRELDRYSFVGGASLYPFAWNLLLAARAEGLGGLMTTLAVREEPAAQALFGAPDHYAFAGVLALGHPVRQPRRLTREPVEHFTFVDSFDEPFRA